MNELTTEKHFLHKVWAFHRTLVLAIEVYINNDGIEAMEIIMLMHIHLHWGML